MAVEGVAAGGATVGGGAAGGGAGSFAGPAGTETRQLNWPGSRDQIRRVSAFSSLHLLYKTLTS